MVNDRKLVKELSETLLISDYLADDLLILAGGDADLVVECSNEAGSLSQLKALIIDSRFRQLERKNDEQEYD